MESPPSPLIRVTESYQGNGFFFLHSFELKLLIGLLAVTGLAD